MEYKGENPDNRTNPAPIMVRTTWDIHKRINDEAKLRGMKQSEFIRQLIVQALDLLEPPIPSVRLKK